MSTPAPPRAAAELYLDLLERSLTRTLHGERYAALRPRGPIARRVFRPLRDLMRRYDLELVRAGGYDPAARWQGRDQPLEAETMVGLARLHHLRECIAEIVGGGVPGDLVQAGVWRGGAAILMRAALEAFGDRQRTVWAADSFAGLPPPDEHRFPADAGDGHWRERQLVATLEEVRDNFRRYGLLDERVRFLEGWFEDTLPAAPVHQIALLHVDCDMYGSTTTALEALYGRVAAGGFVVVDDYSLPGCRQAVDDFRAAHGVPAPLETVDWTAVCWRRPAQLSPRPQP